MADVNGNVQKKTALTFGDEAAFMAQHLKGLVVLADPTGQAKVAVAPELQGRVMTSSASGDAGESFGWVNREVIGSDRRSPIFNPFGGEERFWLGPEGGQFSLYFKKGDPFDLAHWVVPPLIDTEGFDVERQDAMSALFSKNATLFNTSGTKLEMSIKREVRLLAAAEAATLVPGLAPGAEVKMVGYQTVNTISNAGTAAWTRETGMPSIWILGMYNSSPGAVIVLPFKKGSEAELGPVVNDTYFGKIPADRLKVGDGVLFFKGDGMQRGKIGLTPLRATKFAGAFDSITQALTVVTYNKPEKAADYVNSMWELQQDPFCGDVVNAYNDGPSSPGAKPLSFFEVEASSPAAALAPGQSLTHIHTTFHFQGDPAELDKIARAALGAGIAEIQAAFGE